MPKIKKYYVVVETGGNTTIEPERLMNDISDSIISGLDKIGIAKPNEIKVRIKPMPSSYDAGGE